MKIRFVKIYLHHKVGDSIDESEVGSAIANGLVNLGIAERMPEEKPVKKGEKASAAE